MTKYLVAVLAAGLFESARGGHIPAGFSVAQSTVNTLGDGIVIYGTAAQNRDDSAQRPKFIANGETFEQAATFDTTLTVLDRNNQEDTSKGNSATGFFPFGDFKWMKAATGLWVASGELNPNVVAVGTKTSSYIIMETRQMIATCSVDTYATASDAYIATNQATKSASESIIIQSETNPAEYSAQQLTDLTSFVENDPDVTGDNSQCSFSRTGSAIKLGGSDMGGTISTDFYANNGPGTCYFSSNTFFNTFAGSTDGSTSGGCGRQGSRTSLNDLANTFGGSVEQLCDGTTVGNICSSTGAATATSCPQVTWTPGSLKFSMIGMTSGPYFSWTGQYAPTCTGNNTNVTHVGMRMLILLKPSGRTINSADVLANNGNALSSLSASTNIEQLQLGGLKIVFPSQYVHGTKSGTTFTVEGKNTIKIRYVPLNEEAFYLDFLFDGNDLAAENDWASYDPDIDCSGSDCSESSDDDDGLSGGQIAGIVIGVLVAITLIGVIGYYYGYHTIPDGIALHLHLPRHHPHYERVELQKEQVRRKSTVDANTKQTVPDVVVDTNELKTHAVSSV